MSFMFISFNYNLFPFLISLKFSQNFKFYNCPFQKSAPTIATREHRQREGSSHSINILSVIFKNNSIENTYEKFEFLALNLFETD